MYIAIFLIVILMILPFIVSLYFYVDVINKKAFFAIYIFNFIKVFSGYTNLRKKGGIDLHVSNKKAIILDKKLFKKFSGETSFFNAFNLYSVDFIVDVSFDNTALLYTVLFSNNIVSIISKITYLNSRLLKVKSSINLMVDTSNVLNVKGSVIVAFNIICIVKTIFANSINKGVSYAK